MRMCMHCVGSGHIEFKIETAVYRQEWTEDCPVCEGSGYIREEDE